MVIVLIAGFYKKILPLITEEIPCKIIKIVGSKVFMYFDTSLSKKELVKQIDSVIKSNCGETFVYMLYSIYNGKIDISEYLPDSIKQTSPYYNLGTKDLSDQELETFLNQ